MIVPTQPVRRRRFRPIPLMLAALVAVTGLTLATPRQVEAYTWGPWSAPRYFAATATERAIGKRARDSFIGPAAPSWNNTNMFRLRWRKANIVGRPAPWVDKLVQIENVGPFNGYGMWLKTQVRWNGRRVIAEPNPPICHEWAFIVGIERQRCEVVGNNTGRLWLRMDYFVGWSLPPVNVGAGRGATQSVSATGAFGGVWLWP
jgi:hypothetical protein